MIQRREHLGLALEPRESVRIGDEGLGKDLQRDIATELRIRRAIHPAHAAFAEESDDVVVSQPVTDVHRHALDFYRPDPTQLYAAMRGCASLQRASAARHVTPTVSITAPVAAAVLSGSVTITRNAADNAAVAQVQFYANGVALGGPDTAAPYSVSWNTTAVANGPYTLKAVATDTSGNAATSATVAVTVSTPQCPRVSWRRMDSTRRPERRRLTLRETAAPALYPRQRGTPPAVSEEPVVQRIVGPSEYRRSQQPRPDR